MTRQTVSNWENEKSYPDLQTLVDMSDRFDITLDAMLKEDVKMVKNIDKERKFSKYVKRGVLVLFGSLLVLSVIWSITWYNAKQEMDIKFQNGLNQYGFEHNTEEDAYQYPYARAVEQGVKFVAGEMEIASWFSFTRASYNQDLTACIQQEDRLVEIVWYGEDARVMNVYVYDKEGKHMLTNQESKKLLREDEQIHTISKQAEEMCKAMYMDKYNY